MENILVKAQEMLVVTEEALKNFQENNMAVEMDDWSKAIINTIGMVHGQLMTKEVELQTMLPFARSDNPQVEKLKGEVKTLRGRLTELEKSSNIYTPGSEQLSKLTSNSNIPNLGLRYAQLLRDFRTQDTIFEFMTQQYEMARVQEVKDSPAVQVLDRALIPEKRSKPNRKRIVIFVIP